MHRLTHWIFDLPTFPRLIILIAVFGLLGGGLFYSLRNPAPSPINVVVDSSCDGSVASVDPSSSCSDPTTYHDFRYICSSGAEGYLGAEEPYCLTLEQATAQIAGFCAASCLSR